MKDDELDRERKEMYGRSIEADEVKTRKLVEPPEGAISGENDGDKMDGEQ